MSRIPTNRKPEIQIAPTPTLTYPLKKKIKNPKETIINILATQEPAI